MKNNLISFRTLTYLVMMLGAVLVLINFFYNRSFWGDESSLALNIINKSYLELLQPLDYYQSAPILYLQLVKFSSELIPDNEMGLRIFSLISYLFSLVLFYKVTTLITKNEGLVLFALTLFVFNLTMIRYSNEFKQYIFDVLIALALIYFTLKPYRRISRKYLYLSLIGVLSIFLSNISVIVMPAIGLSILYKDFIESKEAQFKYLILLATSWVATFGFYYILFIHNHPVQGFMIDVWREMGAFLPKNPFSADFYTSINNMLGQIFQRIRLVPRVTIINVFIFYPLTITAIYALITQKKWHILIILILPILTHFLLSAFELYPFFMRLVLYLFPIFILLFMVGLEYIVNILEKFIPRASKYISLSVFLLVSVSFFTGLRESFPFKHMEIKELISYLNENISEDEVVYVNGTSISPFNYYLQIGLVDFKNPIILGEVRYGLLDRHEDAALAEEERLISEMKSLKSGKYWLLFTRYSLRDDEKTIINYLDINGLKRIDEFFAPGAALYLYEIENNESWPSEL